MNASLEEKIHVWLIEDNAPFRRAVERVIATLRNVGQVAGFGSCENALAELCSGTPPDIILLDVGLPGMNGIEGIARLKAAAPEAQILILTVFEDDEKIFQAVCAGASGYLLKSSSADEIAAAVDEVHRGGSPMTPRVARRVLEMFSRFGPIRQDYGLAPRERELLELLVEGLTNKTISDRLGLSIHTVDSYLRSVYEKLHVNTRSGAVAKALKERLV